MPHEPLLATAAIHTLRRRRPDQDAIRSLVRHSDLLPIHPQLVVLENGSGMSTAAISIAQLSNAGSGFI